MDSEDLILLKLLLILIIFLLILQFSGIEGLLKKAVYGDNAKPETEITLTGDDFAIDPDSEELKNK